MDGNRTPNTTTAPNYDGTITILCKLSLTQGFLKHSGDASGRRRDVIVAAQQFRIDLLKSDAQSDLIQKVSARVRGGRLGLRDLAHVAQSVATLKEEKN